MVERTCWVGNIPGSVATKQAIKTALRKCGTIEEVVVRLKPGLHKNWALVAFDHAPDANLACDEKQRMTQGCTQTVGWKVQMATMEKVSSMAAHFTLLGVASAKTVGSKLSRKAHGRPLGTPLARTGGASDRIAAQMARYTQERAADDAAGIDGKEPVAAKQAMIRAQMDPNVAEGVGTGQEVSAGGKKGRNHQAGLGADEVWACLSLPPDQRVGQPLAKALRWANQVPAFEGLSTSQVACCITNCGALEVRPGQTVLKPGQPLRHLSIVVSGGVRVTLPPLSEAGRGLNAVVLQMQRNRAKALEVTKECSAASRNAWTAALARSASTRWRMKVNSRVLSQNSSVLVGPGSVIGRDKALRTIQEARAAGVGGGSSGGAQQSQCNVRAKAEGSKKTGTASRLLIVHRAEVGPLQDLCKPP